MSDFTVAIGRAGSGYSPVFPDSVSVRPLLYSWNRIGGPEFAEIEVLGPPDYLWACVQMIGKDVVINNQYGSPVWWGLITEVEIQMDNLNLTLNLAEMANKVRAFYIHLSDAGTPEEMETDWVENDNSVLEFGPYEEVITLDESETAEAEQRRDSFLQLKKYPLPSFSVGSSDQIEVMLKADGYYSLLGKQYYSNDNGIVEHTDGSASQAIGVGCSRTTIGFEAFDRIMFHMGAGYQAGNKIIVTGSSSNNGTHEIEAYTDQEDFTLSNSTTVFFEAPDDIKDTGANLELDVDDVITVVGTTNNNDIWTIETEKVTDTEFEIDNADVSIVTESAGSTTIRRRDYVKLTGDPALTGEVPGSTITVVAYGNQLDQSFQTGTSAAWEMTAVAVKLKKGGSPADNFRIRLYSDSGGSPGTLLDTATLAGSSIYTDFTWTELAFTGGQSLSPSTTYHLVLDRTGGNDDFNFYEVSVDENLEYTGGSFKVYTGSAWVTREPNDADLVFRVIGRVDSTEQMEAIIAASEHLEGFFAEQASGFDTMLFKEGTNKASDEMEALLDAGTSDDLFWVAEVDRDRYLRVWEQPSASEANDYYIAGNGVLFKGERAIIDGSTPVGHWVRIKDLPPIVFGIYTGISPAFIERAEYRVDKGEYKMESTGVPSLFSSDTIRNR